MLKKVLLIAYDFPPLAGPQSLRWIQFAGYLDKNDYAVDVFTVEPSRGNEHATILKYLYSEKSMKMIPEGVSVFRSYPGPLHGLVARLPVEKQEGRKAENVTFKTKIRQAVRSVYKKFVEPLLIPDETMPWLPWGLKDLRKLRHSKYHLVISSGRPFTCHILGYFFTRWTGTPWIMDYGDPWIFNPLYKKRLRSLDSKIEAALLKKARHITVTVEPVIDGFLKYYPFVDREKFTVISQGYDLDQFRSVEPVKGSKFRVVYTGTFIDKIREPYTFFDAIKLLGDIDMEILIAGNILPHHIMAGKNSDLIGRVEFLGPKPHKEVLGLQKGADVLLFLSNDSPYQIPGKIFEYFGARRPILGIEFTKNDPATMLIKKFNRGYVVSNNANEIADAIRKLHAQWKKNEEHFRLDAMNEFTWENQSRRLVDLIEKIISEEH